MELEAMLVVGQADLAVQENDWSDLMRSEELDPLDDGEAVGELLPGEAGERPEQEQSAEGHEEEHGLLEADHRAVKGQGVPSLPPMSA